MCSVQMSYLLGSNLLVADRNSSRECVGMFGTSYEMWLWLCSWRWTPEASYPIANCGVHSCANSTAFLYAIDAGFFFFFYRHRDWLYLRGSCRGCYSLCVCVCARSLSVCVCVHICHTYGNSGSRGNFPLPWPFPQALESPSYEALHCDKTSKHFFHDRCVFLAWLINSHSSLCVECVVLSRVGTVHAEVKCSCSYLCLHCSASVTVDAVDAGERLAELWHCLFRAAIAPVVKAGLRVRLHIVYQVG